MVFVRTTPPRRVDVTAVFPELAPLARAAIRLHPRAGSPSVWESSVGGPLLLPAEEPRPHCESSHPGSGVCQSPAEVRLKRRVRARLRRDMWCPYDHEPHAKPSTALFWRSAEEVGDVLAVPPEPYEADWEGYVPEPCLLAPEQITEYPNGLDLGAEVRQLLGDWSRRQAAEVGVDSSYADYPQEFYDSELADAPGWKVGGWPPWGRADPYRRFCAVCDAQMVPLLTIASFEWDGGTRGWAPYEDQAAAFAAGQVAGQNPAQPTAVEVGSTDNLQLYVCPASPEHPHTGLIQ
ncbi:hypothetical protein J7F03_40315 [Streptomyces sp. ISL-43]|uniref:hypothetical protein n=1 Tax=Streptomyces sp. ISL-43 TaxID=2819183 RepID=UPI001BE9B0E2|nr:hypothetical protein [Streptomyces sp. ISL-43]MBT2453154.1 hypothetical protein [Streptomyces sp. ISL-43]